MSRPAALGAPHAGRVAPRIRFIPIAEETGLIVAIGDWVLRRAVEQAAAWQRAGSAAGAHGGQPVGAPTDAAGPRAAHRELFARSGLDPRLFGVEVTESMLISNFDQAVQHLRALRALGVEVSLDDFGTGLLEPELPAQAAGRRGQDRPLAGARRHCAGGGRVDHARDHHDGASTADEGARRRRRKRRPGGAPGGQPMRPDAGLLVQRRSAGGSGRVDAARGPPDRPGAARPPLAKRTLLLVDDEENIVAALRRLLRAEGWNGVSATSAEQALRRMARHEVDVMLSDQRMPGMTGVELLRRAKELYPDTIRLVLSGYTELQSITDAINEGAIYKFLAKPWDDEQLRAHLREAFALKEWPTRTALGREVQATNRNAPS